METGMLMARFTANMSGMKKITLVLALFGFLILNASHADAQLDQLELPQGFSIEIYAEGVENARQMAVGDEGKLWAVTDPDCALLISDDMAGVIYKVSYAQ